MSKEMKSILFTTFLFVLFLLMAWEANSFAELAKFFPFFVAMGAACIAFLSIILQTIDLVKNKRKMKEKDDENEEELKTMAKYVFWVVGYILLIYVIGFMPSTIVFLMVFLLFESKFRVLTAVLSTALVIGLLLAFGNVMNLYWPIGLLGITIFS